MKKAFVLVYFLSLLFLCREGISETAQSEHYRVAVGDKLNIIVYLEPDLSGSFGVKENGTITYPLLGQVHVENLTKLEIEKKLTTLLAKDYLVNPSVRVSIDLYSKHEVLLLGHVKNPGTYNFPEGGSLTLLELVTKAGGFTGYASINGTKVVRTTKGDKKIVINPRVNDIISGRSKDIELKPGDLIIVPERLF